MTFTTTIITAQNSARIYDDAGKALRQYLTQLVRNKTQIGVILHPRYMVFPIVFIGSPGYNLELIGQRLPAIDARFVLRWVTADDNADQYTEISKMALEYADKIIANKRRYIIIQNDENVESPLVILCDPQQDLEVLARAISSII